MRHLAAALLIACAPAAGPGGGILPGRAEGALRGTWERAGVGPFGPWTNRMTFSANGIYSAWSQVPRDDGCQGIAEGSGRRWTTDGSAWTLDRSPEEQHTFDLCAGEVRNERRRTYLPPRLAVVPYVLEGDLLRFGTEVWVRVS